MKLIKLSSQAAVVCGNLRHGQKLEPISCSNICCRAFSDQPDKAKTGKIDFKLEFHPNTPLGRLDRTPKGDREMEMQAKAGTRAGESLDPFARFPDNTNPATGEMNGPTGPEPTRYGDWERKGRCTDF